MRSEKDEAIGRIGNGQSAQETRWPPVGRIDRKFSWQEVISLRLVKLLPALGESSVDRDLPGPATAAKVDEKVRGLAGVAGTKGRGCVRTM